MKYRDDFSFLDKDVVYLDSASTSLKPKIVINDLNDYLDNFPLSYGKAISKYNRLLNKKVDKTLNLVRDFINAQVLDEVLFTFGATDASRKIIDIIDFQDNDEILFCPEDHDSSIAPFIHKAQELKKYNININLVNILISGAGDYDDDDLLAKVNQNTKVVILTHIHNVYGLEMNIKELIFRIKEKNKNTIVVIDASQSAGHIKVDVQDLNPDFLYFTSHKMFGLGGSGVLYIKGSLPKDVKDYIDKGTKDYLSIISLGKAIEYINSIGIDKIEEKIYNLTRYLYDKLSKIDGIEFNKGIAVIKCVLGYGIISFRFTNQNTRDFIQILDEYNIIVRSNNFCNSINQDYIRVSLNIYNNEADIDKFIKIVKYFNTLS